MKEIVVLGQGEKAMELAIRAVKAANQLGLEYRLTQTADEDEIISHGVIVTPAVVIDGRLALSGETPEIETLRKLLA